MTGQKKRRRKPYTTGELNKMVDSICHPLADENSSLILVDGLLHALVERNPQLSVQKFIKYSLLPKILEKGHGKKRKHKN